MKAGNTWVLVALLNETQICTWTTWFPELRRSYLLSPHHTVNEARLLPFSAGMVRLWAGRCGQLSGAAVLPADVLATVCYITATLHIVWGGSGRWLS